MPVVQGVQIHTTGQDARTIRGAQVIANMRKLLDARFHYQVGRRAFLARWGRLRTALRLTPEYDELRRTVIARARGVCESPRGCHRTIAHVHHIKRVAWFPELALDPTNCQGLCEECHTAAHRRPSGTSKPAEPHHSVGHPAEPSHTR